LEARRKERITYRKKNRETGVGQIIHSRKRRRLIVRRKEGA